MKQRIILALLLGLVVISHAYGPAHESLPTEKKETSMKASHVHLGVKDLPAAVQWLDKVWKLRPTFQNERMASVPFGDFTIIFDTSAADTPATLGFESKDCDEDFRIVRSRGGIALEEPKDRPWGVRVAYIQGPGALKFEIEQALPRAK